jgi:hypothetical protein
VGVEVEVLVLQEADQAFLEDLEVVLVQEDLLANQVQLVYRDRVMLVGVVLEVLHLDLVVVVVEVLDLQVLLVLLQQDQEVLDLLVLLPDRL